MARDKILVQGVLMTRDAAARVEEAEVNVQADVDAVRRGQKTREDLLVERLEAFEETEYATAASWKDYVDAVMEAAKGPELQLLEVLRKAEDVCRYYNRFSPVSREDFVGALAALRTACGEARTALKRH